MKLILTIVPFLLFCALTFIQNESIDKPFINNNLRQSEFKEGVLKSEYKHLVMFSDYNINAILDSAKKTIFVEQDILWTNKSNYSTREIWLKLDANSLKSNNTEYAVKNFIKENEQTCFSDLQFWVNGKPYSLQYKNLHSNTINDSTSAFVELDSALAPGEYVKLKAKYSIKIPKPSYGIGVAENRNFYFISDWYIKVAVYENRKWYNYPTPSYISYFEEFAKFNVTITVPKSFKCGGSSNIIKKEITENQSKYFFSKSGINNFTWFAGPELAERNFLFHRKGNPPVLVSIFAQPEKGRFFDRYQNIITHSLKYLESKFGVYPYQSLTLVDLPRTYSNIKINAANLISIKSNFVSPIGTQKPEHEISEQIVKQYFGHIVSTNQIIDIWLEKGLSRYLASRILINNYGKSYNSFNIATYLPIYGMNFVSYNEIPIIYSLGKFPIEHWEKDLLNYYNNNSVGALSNNVFELPDKNSFEVMSSVKPELVLMTLENYLGKEKFDNILFSFYNRNKFRHATVKDFINLSKQKTEKNLIVFFKNTVQDASYFDYRIKYLKKVNESEYDVYAERLGDGIFHNTVALYTDKDTLIQNWKDDNKWRIFRFSTKNEVIGAEIDPMQINKLDINFANNSYLLSPNYLITFSLAVRYFFWIQNALMILGSIV